jgi:DNA repair exonuclease SbcCD ATPase subunit
VKLHLNRRFACAAETPVQLNVDMDAAEVDEPLGEPLPSPQSDEATGEPAVCRVNVVLPRGNPRIMQAADIAEVEALRAQQALTPFRTLETFSYSVGLLFHRAQLSYYVTLRHQGTLWRAICATEFDVAEAAFGQLEQQAVELAGVEAKRAQLEAQNRHALASIEALEAHAQRLRANLRHGEDQTRLVAENRQQVRREVAHLEAYRAAARAQLSAISRQIHNLTETSNEYARRLQRRG